MYVHVHVCTRHFVHCTYNENNYTKTRITVEPPIKDPPRKGTTSLYLLVYYSGTTDKGPSKKGDNLSIPPIVYYSGTTDKGPSKKGDNLSIPPNRGYPQYKGQNGRNNAGPIVH